MTPSKNTKVKTKTPKENTMSSPTTDRPDLSNQIVTSTQIANMLDVPASAVTVYKKRDDFPQPAFVSGRTTLYWRDEVEAWVKDKMKQRKKRAADLEARAQAMLEKAKRMRSK